MQTIQDTPAYAGKNRYGRSFNTLDLRAQLTVLLDVVGTRHLHRDKPVSFKTKKDRAAFIHQAVSDLHAAGLRIKNILNLGQRHAQALVDRWRDKELAPATIVTRLSHLRWLATAIGKRGLVLSPENYGLPPEEVDRHYAAEEDRSWKAHGVDPDEYIARAAEIDKWAGTSLELMKEFGLRLTESILIRPSLSDCGSVLVVEEGTKGGRTRVVPIRTASQRAALDRAKELAACSELGALVPPGKTPAQARRRIYYVCERLGINASTHGVTLHGLRHGFANDLYEEVAGAPSLVRGGSNTVDRAADARARQAVSQALGHKRLSITAAYTGARRRGRPPGQPSRD